MKPFIAVFAALALSAVASIPIAQARPLGHPFLRGQKTPVELSVKVAASLALDPSGRSIVDRARCAQDHSCATPADYFEMFKESDPGARLTSLAGLPDFLRSLVPQAAPKGEYWLACLKEAARSRELTAVLHCVSRYFTPKEQVWVDPTTRRPVLASDCTNPIEKPVKSACAEIHFFARPGDTVARYGLLGPAMLDSDCFGLKHPGEAQFERWWHDECPEAGCDFSIASAFYQEPVLLIGSTTLSVPGEYVLRVPAVLASKRASAYAVALCLERGSKVSDGVGVRNVHYRESRRRIAVATVWYSVAEIPARTPDISWTWGETPRLQ